MSGIYIPGMEMPTSCGQCRFFAWKRGVGQHCAVDDRITFHATLDGFNVGYERNGTCPLIPVPPHGRLIDANAIRADIDAKRPDRCYEDAWTLTVIDNAPTIILADEKDGVE